MAYEPIRVAGDSGPDPERWLLDSRDVAQLLGLGRTKVFLMMARRELPVVQIGRCVRVPREALKVWLSRRTELGIPVDRVRDFEGRP